MITLDFRLRTVIPGLHGERGDRPHRAGRADRHGGAQVTRRGRRDGPRHRRGGESV